jgi:hypothetical protein
MKSAIIVMLLCATASAEDINFARLHNDTNIVTVTTGAEHGLVVGAGYARVMALAGHRFVVGGDLTLAGAEMDAHDMRLRAGALAPLVTHGGWKLIGGVSAVVRTTDNDVARMTDVGSDISLLGGHYTRRWFAAGELGFDWALATHIDHSDVYRMTTYPDARDGWYGNAGGLLRFGLQGGVSFGGNDVILRAGMLRDIQGNPTMFPIYATLAYDRRW